jgi:hypothetical protein
MISRALERSWARRRTSAATGAGILSGAMGAGRADFEAGAGARGAVSARGVSASSGNCEAWGMLAEADLASDFATVFFEMDCGAGRGAGELELGGCAVRTVERALDTVMRPFKGQSERSAGVGEGEVLSAVTVVGMLLQGVGDAQGAKAILVKRKRGAGRGRDGAGGSLTVGSED